MKLYNTTLGFVHTGESLQDAVEVRDRALKVLEDAGFDVGTCTTQPQRGGMSQGISAFDYAA